jgi:2,5-diamino-6-(ribosylamino)-4(3H)-pyrimidinone 5'-phosphate reductase
MDRSRPYVVGHVAVSLDGATGGFEPDVATFYELARTWAEDVTLTGADTILAQEIALRDAPRPGPAEGGPLLAVVDGRRRVRHWDALREVGHWSDVVALRCTSTPRADASSVDEIVVGATRVDLVAALRALGERPGVEVVRVDSGGGLLGALLEAELVDEVSLLVHPCLVGRAHERRWHGQAVVPTMAVTGCTALDGLVWLRYRLGQEPAPGGHGAAHLGTTST